MTVIDKKEARRLLKAEKAAEKHSQARNLISRRTNFLFNVLLIVFCVLIIFPLWIIVISSVTSESALTTYGYRLWPIEFSVNAYTYLFRDGSIILTAYKNTLIATLAGETAVKVAQRARELDLSPISDMSEKELALTEKIMQLFPAQQAQTEKTAQK